MNNYVTICNTHISSNTNTISESYLLTTVLIFVETTMSLVCLIGFQNV